MQLAIRPVAIRALLLLIGIALGLVAFLGAFAAATSASSHGHPVASKDSTVTAKGISWN